MRGAKKLRWRETDRLLSIALQAYEDRLCSGCGQDTRYSMDYRLEDYWGVMSTVRCQGCDALAQAHKADEDAGKRNTQALRHVIGLHAGWEDAISDEA